MFFFIVNWSKSRGIIDRHHCCNFLIGKSCPIKSGRNKIISIKRRSSITVAEKNMGETEGEAKDFISVSRLDATPRVDVLPRVN